MQPITPPPASKQHQSTEVALMKLRIQSLAIGMIAAGLTVGAVGAAPEQVPPAALAPPIVSIADGTGCEDDCELGYAPMPATFAVTLSRPSARPVRIVLTARELTAGARLDYGCAPWTSMVFKPGEVAKTFAVPVYDDQQPEPDETFLVAITSVEGAQFGRGEAVGTIQDDD
jgi:hypothetical protein